MSEAIERLEERDYVVKTEYTRYVPDDGGEVAVEVWHDLDGLQKLFERVLGPTVSEKAVRKHAEKTALAVRKTTIDITKEFK